MAVLFLLLNPGVLKGHYINTDSNKYCNLKSSKSICSEQTKLPCKCASTKGKKKRSKSQDSEAFRILLKLSGTGCKEDPLSNKTQLYNSSQ